MLNNHISVATIMYATVSPCVPLNGMFHQDSATQWNKNFDVSNSLGKRHANSIGAQYVCDKSKTSRVCAKWQWNALDWCYWNALPASLVVQSSNTVSFVSLSFRTHPCILTMLMLPDVLLCILHHTTLTSPKSALTPCCLFPTTTCNTVLERKGTDDSSQRKIWGHWSLFLG